ncbi:uncharacterized protein PHACADRAFT_203917 [Phanerochaete carnosa HHB-10118-sp]|uniref:BZIP domain-containing protein n=1 Tax=Phanerochaete carnosa (strain HHB-10118-sp) TaxID=650164 RepID=K5WNH5_PHACS|nr:uncharacterized protein PHACADRAFT_203917 [Phanerochaete carnosa HHB-10118-sp]EKM60764.1 hypothetical protein PHACADRAFT_203917 [Phanerochaete carnosa HHB-10118-sp]
MDHRQPHHPNSYHHQQPSGSTSRRRARSYSQPLASPVPGPSHRPPDPLEYLYHPTHVAGPSTSAELFPPPLPDFDDEFLRSILAMPDEHQGPQTHLPPFFHMPNMPQMAQQQPIHQLPTQQSSANPVLQQAFVTWLQYMQLQLHLQQQQSQQQQQQQHQQQTAHQQTAHLQTQQMQHQRQHAQSSNALFTPTPFPTLPPIDTSASYQRDAVSPEQTTSQPTSTPSPMSGNEGPDADMSATGLSEEKRRRNTAASGESESLLAIVRLTNGPYEARFRIKKKQWTLNLERSITELSGRVEELEREASELRRENGWLKEIVMLKSKRYGGPTPLASAAQASTSSTEAPTDPESSANAGGEPEETSEVDAGGKGKEAKA